MTNVKNSNIWRLLSLITITFKREMKKSNQKLIIVVSKKFRQLLCLIATCFKQANKIKWKTGQKLIIIIIVTILHQRNWDNLRSLWWSIKQQK